MIDHNNPNFEFDNEINIDDRISQNSQLISRSKSSREINQNSERLYNYAHIYNEKKRQLKMQIEEEKLEKENEQLSFKPEIVTNPKNQY